ncbi:MAG: monovalent cation/H(+) antiporter subunit G [Candidatus Bipolaricaulia bacterium]
MTSLILSGLGAAFVLIGTLGILRFRDVYSRLQASGVSDTVGTALILIGLIVSGGWQPHDATLILLLFLLLLTNPIATHSIAKSAFTRGHRGHEGSEEP